MQIAEANSSNRDPLFEWMFEVHVPDRVLIQYRKRLLSTREVHDLESHLVLCPVCQLQLVDLPLPESESRVSCYA